MYIITNIDGIKKRIENNDEFISYVQSIFKENEEMDTPLTKPVTLDECKYYMANYCPNLTLS